jgi:hypothetical protein
MSKILLQEGLKKLLGAYSIASREKGKAEIKKDKDNYLFYAGAQGAYEDAIKLFKVIDEQL